MLNSAQVKMALEKNAVLLTARRAIDALSELFGAPRNGDYTAALVQLIAEYQASVGLRMDGIVGKATFEALQRQKYLEGESCWRLWPSAVDDPAQQAAHYRSLCELLNEEPPSARPFLIGLRGVYTFGRRTHRVIHSRRYDDAFILLKPDHPPVVFRGATHAYQLAAAETPDENNGDLGDVGSIRPGRYVLHLLTTSPPQFQIKTPEGDTRLPAFRDTDHNGVISATEAEEAESALDGPRTSHAIGMFASGVLFHPGYEEMKSEASEHFSSIACQTAPLSVLEYLRDAGSEIEYLLVNANRLARLARVNGAPSTIPSVIPGA
jgi:Putative peptidoglycan binding domain